MVKVKECCCGCTLRTGTLILAWMVLVWNSIVFLIVLTNVFVLLQGSKNHVLSNYSVYTFIYLLVDSIIAIVISAVAIWAVQKKKAKYLNGLFWYFCYVAVVYVIQMILVIADPSLEKEIAQNEYPVAESSFKVEDHIILLIAANLFVIAITVYFALVVKSNRDYMLKNQAQIGDFEADRPDPTTIGYMNNV